VQTGALVIAPTSMMTNQEASKSFLKSYILRKIGGPYFNVFHGCHVDNDVVTEYFSGLDDAANQQLNWTLTRPTEMAQLRAILSRPKTTAFRPRMARAFVTFERTALI
jgi:hypothetical protein